MKRFPMFPRALALAAGVLVAGCGGGGGTSADPIVPPGTQAVSLSGAVTEKDGETTDLGGIRLRLLETGEVAETATDGSFAFGPAAPGSLTLRVEMPVAPLRVEKGGADDGASGSDDGTSGADDAPDVGEDVGGDPPETEAEAEAESETEHGPEAEFEDDDDDEREESSDDGVRVEDTQGGETVRVRIRIENGQIVETRTSRSDGDEREVEIRMARQATSDDPDIEGEVELESRADREKFEVEVEHASPGRRLAVHVIDPAGVTESQGTRVVDALGQAEWELATNDGARLPLGAGSVADLADHTVEVRDADTNDLLLSVVLPEMPASAPSTDDTGSGSGSGDESERLRGRARLAASEPGLEGYVEVRRRVDEDRDRFKMEAQGLAPGRVVAFRVEDPGLAGTFLSLGTYAADGSGEAQVELDTHDGDLLPGNVRTVADLTGLAVEVRDGSSGALLLAGTVPAPVLDD